MKECRFATAWVLAFPFGLPGVGSDDRNTRQESGCCHNQWRAAYVPAHADPNDHRSAARAPKSCAGHSNFSSPIKMIPTLVVEST